MRISEQRYQKDLRRYALAHRMVQHEARRGTIVRWTGLSRHRVAALLRSCERPDKSRLRGPPPCTASFFCKSLAHELESAAFAYVAMQMGVISVPSVEGVGVEIYSLARGERVVKAFELYHAVVPDTRFTLEHAMLLISELSSQEFLLLETCDRCEGLRVREKVGTPQPLCAFCRTKGLRPPVPVFRIAGEISPVQSSDRQASNT